MPTPLLKTKLYPPQERPGLVARPRLIEKLERGMNEGRQVFLVSAPAGYGKSTLIGEWLSHRDVARVGKSQSETRSSKPVLDGPLTHSAWLLLDEQDNDPYRFWRYVTAALQRIEPEFGKDVLQALEASPPPPLPRVLMELINEIDAFPDSVFLVLDDYHVISAASVHDSLSFALEKMPHRLVLILITRADPSLPLARLRANQQLVEVRSGDLRFNLEEAAAFLRARVDCELTNEDLELVAARTEGWAVGLQLAALSLQGYPDPRPFIRDFSGRQQYVLEYLLEQVLNRQPTRVQEFLLQTAVLERLCGSLCDTVTGGADGAAMLANLFHANLFLIPLDEQQTWYRYHRLFHDLLQARLQQFQPNLVPELHKRAAEWYGENGYPDEAIEHAFAAKDYARAAELIEREGHKRWALSDSAFLSMIGRLPQELLLAHPALGLYQAWLLVTYGQVEAVEKFLPILFSHVPPDDSTAEMKAMRSFLDLLRAYIPEWLGQPPAATLPDRRALEFIPEGRLAMRNSADVVYALMLYMRGEFDLAEELLMGTVRRDVAAGGTTAIPIAISQTSRMWMLRGRLHRAASLCREYLTHVQGRGKWRFYLAGNLQIVLGEILREWNDLARAEAEIQEGIRTNEPWHSSDATVTGSIMLARVQVSRGTIEEAYKTLSMVEHVMQGQRVSPHLKGELDALKIRLWLAGNKLDAALAWAEQLGADLPLDFRYEREHITLARIKLADGRFEEAAAFLTRLDRAAARGGRTGRQIEIKSLRAIALYRLGHIAEALEELGRALALAHPEGFARVFLDEGEVVCGLLSAYARAPSAANGKYARELLAAFERSASGAVALANGLEEPLTPRELEILRLLGHGMSNQAIAEKLVITVSAVKKHTGNIFGKLGVTSRLQAIVRARELGLMQDDS